jgi:plasmid maintenance system antidote protein VapI
MHPELKQFIDAAVGLSLTDAAAALGVSRATIKRLRKAHKAVSTAA